MEGCVELDVVCGNIPHSVAKIKSLHTRTVTTPYNHTYSYHLEMC